MVQQVYTGITLRKANSKVITYRFYPNNRYVLFPVFMLNLLLCTILLPTAIAYKSLYTPLLTSCILFILASGIYVSQSRSFEITISSHHIYMKGITFNIAELRQIHLRQVKLPAFQRGLVAFQGRKPSVCYITLQGEFSYLHLPLKLDEDTVENFVWLVTRMGDHNGNKLVPVVSVG